MEYLPVHTASYLAIIIIFSSCGFGQTETVTGPAGGAIEAGRDAGLTCIPDSGTSSFYTWNDRSGGNDVRIVTNGGTIDSDAKYSNFASTPPGDELTITAAAVDDEGQYVCGTDVDNSPVYILTVEVGSPPNITLPTEPLRAGNTFTATCDVVGSRPQLEISWTLNGQSLDGTPSNPPSTDPDLYNTRSVVTISPNVDTNGQDLECITSGHVVTSLKSEATTSTQLNVQYAPTSQTATIDVEFTKEGDTQLRITCQVSAVDNSVASANPAINNYTIYAGSVPIHTSTTQNFVVVDIPENATDYKCSASNDVGTIESEGVNYDPGLGGLSTGAIVGIVIGVLLLIALVVVLVVFLVKKKDSG